MFKSSFWKFLVLSLSFSFLQIVSGSVTAGQAAEALGQSKILGRLQTEVGDFGSSQIGLEELKKRTQALEIDEVLSRTRQFLKHSHCER